MSTKKLTDNMDLNDIVGPTLRDDRDLMSYPFMSLSKKKRTEPIEYTNKKLGIEILVTGNSHYGIMTIFDYDFMLWIISSINKQIDAGEEASNIVKFHPNKFLSQAGWYKNKNKGGFSYNRLEITLKRMVGTSVYTTIKSDGKKHRIAWNWLSRYEWYENIYGEKTDYVEVEISQWIFNRIKKDRSVLSISENYYKLTSGIEKWLYRIARRHCGNQDIIRYSAHGLFSRYPAINRTNEQYRLFKYRLKKIVEKNQLPEYKLYWDDSDKGKEVVLIFPRPGSREERKIPRSARGILEWDD